MALIAVAEAVARIVAGVVPLPCEAVPLGEALDRALGRDLAARRTQPPWNASAMDGYAVRAADIETVPVTLKVIGAAPAGHPFSGRVKAGDAVRIFTGAPVPQGADTVVIQEDTERQGDQVLIRQSVAAGRNVRQRGIDFHDGEVLIQAGRRLRPRDIALAAAMNHADLPVCRRPRIAVLATGDELAPPGTDPGPDRIISSNSYGVAAMIRQFGGEPVDLGIARDTHEALADGIRRAQGMRADVLVTLGGASVGDHDLVQESLKAEGLALDFWKIAMRPGKPLMFGRLGDMRVLGLPGNPVSAMVCARLFLIPLVEALLGLADPAPGDSPAILGADLPENDHRQDYLRATVVRDAAGRLVATPFARQDSSMLSTLCQSDAFIVRAPHAPPARAGDPCTVMLLDF
jgi:molybdopterin molybdotransferase